MSVSTKNLESYLQRFIKEVSLYDFIPEILESFNYLHLQKNELFVEEGKILASAICLLLIRKTLKTY